MNYSFRIHSLTVTMHVLVVQIESHTVHFRERAQPRCGSLDYVNHTPGGGYKKVLLMMERVLSLQCAKISLFCDNFLTSFMRSYNYECSSC